MSYSTIPDRRPAVAPPLGSLLAGARARGVAEGFAWLGLAAILVDDRGEALDVNAGAAKLMGDLLFLERGRLHAREPAADAALGQALRAALTRGLAASLQIGPASELRLHVAAMPAKADDPYRLLRAVVLLSPAQMARH